jgi:S-(hydroxymethyl)glutathione dehydrogenase/alcohol dehydrogenase
MRGRIRLDEMVTATMPLDEINRAFDLMRQADAIRSVILYS